MQTKNKLKWAGRRRLRASFTKTCMDFILKLGAHSNLEKVCIKTQMSKTVHTTEPKHICFLDPVSVELRTHV